MAYLREDHSGMLVKDEEDDYECTYDMFKFRVLAVVSLTCRTIPELDAEDEGNSNVFGDSGDGDAMEMLLDTRMEAEAEELEEESQDE
ncbi:hypothetical protein AHAS_Ahas01G0104600 [Arachis hypogaea]